MCSMQKNTCTYSKYLKEKINKATKTGKMGRTNKYSERQPTS